MSTYSTAFNVNNNNIIIITTTITEQRDMLYAPSYVNSHSWVLFNEVWMHLITLNAKLVNKGSDPIGGKHLKHF